jgi:hypothetical protein
MPTPAEPSDIKGLGFRAASGTPQKIPPDLALQRAPSLLAGKPCGVGCISESSKLVRSVVKPALHVGKQISGGLGCTADRGNGGIAGGSTAGAAKFCKPLAQPVTSRASGISISPRTGQLRFCFIHYLLERSNTPLFFNPRSRLSLTRSRLAGRNHDGVLLPGLGMR